MESTPINAFSDSRTVVEEFKTDKSRYGPSEKPALEKVPEKRARPDLEETPSKRAREAAVRSDIADDSEERKMQQAYEEARAPLVKAADDARKALEDHRSLELKDRPFEEIIALCEEQEKLYKVEREAEKKLREHERARPTFQPRSLAVPDATSGVAEKITEIASSLDPRVYYLASHVVIPDKSPCTTLPDILTMGDMEKIEVAMRVMSEIKVERRTSLFEDHGIVASVWKRAGEKLGPKYEKLRYTGADALERPNLFLQLLLCRYNHYGSYEMQDAILLYSIAFGFPAVLATLKALDKRATSAKKPVDWIPICDSRATGFTKFVKEYEETKGRCILDRRHSFPSAQVIFC